MNASAHTPGPWHLTYLGRNGSHRQLFVEADGPVLICDMQLEACVASTRNITEADARLIAAAPDLLDAACKAIEALNTGSDSDYVQMRIKAKQILAAAVAKAEG